nr:hypothetical protein [Lachnospiraceae bacterium]
MYKIGENYKYIFDSNGLNGASQRRPESDPSKYADIVRKYHKDFTDDEVKKCLHMLRTEGCGYAALVNTVFLRFFGEEEQFQKIFGYPMYTSDGKLNFDDLLVDFYCATDNHYGLFGFDLVDKKEDEKYEKGYGTTLESSEWRFETYMKKHGVSVDVRQ